MGTYQIVTDASVLILFISLFCLGIYLIFYKRKLDETIKPEVWLDKLNLSPNAKKVRLKEITKQTEKIFTRKWFLEYWQGERTAFSAWFTWLLIGDNLINIVIHSTIYLIASHWTFPVILAIFCIFAHLIYEILAFIMLWKCAKNSTPFNKYFARFLVVLYILKFLKMFILYI